MVYQAKGSRCEEALFNTGCGEPSERGRSTWFDSNAFAVL